MLDAPELDAATADAVAGEFARASKHGLPLGAPCPNCGTALKGPWCHACGQRGADYHRSIWHLVAEAFEGLTHFDGRFWQTLPRLAIKPGRLTRDYLDGRRASQIPPFRLYLVVLLLVFFAGSLSVEHARDTGQVAVNDSALSHQMTPDAKAQLDQAFDALKEAPGAKKTPTEAWWRDRIVKTIEQPERFVMALEQWGHRFAVLMLPLAALLLSVLFVLKRDVYVFDHLIFSMHSLAFQGLLLTAAFLLALATPSAWWLLAAAPAHLFVHMRGTYRTSVFGTLARMALLFISSTVAFSLLLAGLVVIGLASVH